MNVEGLMSDAVLMVEPDDRLDTAEMMMSLAESRHVPVVSDGRLVGIISLRDLLEAQPAAGTEADRLARMRRLHARDVMTHPALTIDPHDTVRQAAELMLSHRISSLPVVDEDMLVGIVTTADLLGYAGEALREPEPRIQVASLMHPQPLHTVQTAERLDVARLLMRAGPCRHLPVFEGRRLVGMLSDRDILAALPSRLEALTEPERIRAEAAIAVGEVMSSDLVGIGPRDEAAQAAELLLEHQIGELPVLDDDRLVGIITETDFLRWLCRPRRPGA